MERRLKVGSDYRTLVKSEEDIYHSVSFDKMCTDFIESIDILNGSLAPISRK